MAAGVVVNAGFIDRTTTWDDSVAAVTGWIPATTESLNQDPQLTRSVALGQVSQYPGQLTKLVAAGDLNAELDYNYGAGMLEFALGAEAAGVYDTADELPYVGLAIDKGVARFLYGCTVVDRMTISGSPNNPVTVTYGCVAYEEARTGTAFPSIRPAESLQERVMFEDVTVWLGITGAALDSGDVIGISGFEITLENTMKLDDIDSESDLRILAPQRNGPRGASLRLDFPRFTSVLHTGGTHPLNTWRDSHTQLQCSLTFTGTGGTYVFRCPIMHLSEGANANVGGPEMIPESAMFTLEGGVNSDMSGADQLQMVNT